jgi:hypothetical protein
VSGKSQPMPRHFDGGRACLVMAVSLWTDRVLRVFDEGGASVALTRLQHFFNTLSLKVQYVKKGTRGESRYPCEISATAVPRNRALYSCESVRVASKRV